jgi:hypothetical protein
MYLFSNIAGISIQKLLRLWLLAEESGTRVEVGRGREQVIATVPNSRINSWESWFIFNLHKSNNHAWEQLSVLESINNQV